MSTVLSIIVVCSFLALLGSFKMSTGQHAFVGFVVYAVIGFSGVGLLLLFSMPQTGSGYGVILVPAGAFGAGLLSGTLGALSTYLFRKKHNGVAGGILFVLLILLIALVLNFWK